MSKNTELYKKASEAIPGEDDRNFVLRQIRNGWCMGYEQAEKELGWISVKDRLPEDDGWYLTCVRMEHLGNTPQIVCPLFFWKKYKRWEDADGLYNGKIDHWMPIPKLPMEDEK